MQQYPARRHRTVASLRKPYVAPAETPSPATSTNTRINASTTPASVAGSSEVTVQLATRISPDVAAVLDAAVALEKARLGSKTSQRALLKEAILAHWGH